MSNLKEKVVKEIANKISNVAENTVEASPYWYSPFLFGHEINLNDDNEENNQDKE